jgi:hypothetical protein
MKAKTSPKSHKHSVVQVGKTSAAQIAMQQNFISDIGQLQSDFENVFKDQEDIISRPKILYSLAATVAATCAAAYYHGTSQVSKLALKAIYATLSQIIGINVGLAVDNEHVDNITFAGGYYLLTSMSGNLSRFNQNNGMEAIAGAVAGYATNYYFSNQ